MKFLPPPPRRSQQRSQPAVYQLHRVQDLRFLNYAKWLEKLDYYLRTNPSRERSVSIASSSAAAPSAERLALEEKRAAIFEDKADDDLTAKDKAVYKYRAERKRQWSSLSGYTTLSEQLYNEQYDEEQLAGVKKSLAALKEKGTPKQRKSGDGSTEQARR